MAVDEALLASATSGASPATLRLYGWRTPTVSIGYGQGADAFSATQLPVVRRLTGGRAVLHQDELTYSVVCGRDSALFGAGIGGAYEAISSALVSALRSIGVDAGFSKSAAKWAGKRSEACFSASARYEVTVGGRKLVGSAQRRFKDGFLQHGSILISIDADLTEAVFGEAAASRMLSAVASLSEFGGVGREELAAAVARSFASCLGVSLDEGALTDDEEERAVALEEVGSAAADRSRAAV